jgi:hypothetical protein
LRVSGVPRGQLCPEKIKFFPHEKPEFAISSECLVDGFVVNRIFKFRIEVDLETNLYYPDRVNLISTHNTNLFSNPDFCLTNGFIHVFETDTEATNSSTVMTSFVADETDGSSFYIPIKQSLTSNQHVHAVSSFHCVRSKNAVVIAADIGNTTPAVTGIFTINVDQIYNPNKRVHSGVFIVKPAAPIALVAGSRMDHDQLIILGTTQKSTEFYSFYASLNGPHFKYPFTDIDVPKTTNSDFLITMSNVRKDKLQMTKTVKIVPFVTQGRIIMKAAGPKLEISGF